MIIHFLFPFVKHALPRICLRTVFLSGSHRAASLFAGRLQPAAVLRFLSPCSSPHAGSHGYRHALPCKRLQPKAGRQTNFVCRPVAFLSARRCRSPAFCAAPFICPSVRLQAVIAPLGGAYCFLSIPGSFFQALSSADLRCLPAFLLLPSAPVRSAENRIFFAAPLPPCAPLCAAFPCIARGS